MPTATPKKTPPQKVYLMILDGFGHGKKYSGNAIEGAKMVAYQKLLKEFPHTLLKASGQDVGIPQGTQGNSEVGHFTMGAGRVVNQSLEEINQSMKSGAFFKNKVLLKAFARAKKNKTPLHLVGMVSDEGVHAHIAHLCALLEMAKKQKVKQVFVHAITDGRDVPERSAQKYLRAIQKKIRQLKLDSAPQSSFHTNKPKTKSGTAASVATIIGRYYAMDRDNNWDRTQKAYDLLTAGAGAKAKDPIAAIKSQYQSGVKTDYYIEPVILDPKGTIHTKDAVIFFNYRTDRPRQLTQMLTKVHPYLVCFGDYTDGKAPVAFPAPTVQSNLAETLEKNHKTQLHLAETEKFAHVTYFFNSQSHKKFPHEKRIMVKSKKTTSFAKVPGMSAKEITKEAVKILSQKTPPDFIVQNFANPDLVGHSGDLKATIQACKILDQCIKTIAAKSQEKNYALLITADHGNAEYMTYTKNGGGTSSGAKSGDPCPSHTTNPVPFLLVSKALKNATLASGLGLQDVAPTVLHIMGIPKPRQMTGKSLITKL